MAQMEVELDRCYAPRDEQVRTRQVTQEMVIVDMQNGVYHGLNPVGVQVWELLDGTRPLRQVVDEVANAYPQVSRDTIQADLVALMQQLLDAKLVVAR